MNTKLLLLALGVVAFSSCSTAYKAGQTPDDVYFSPAREQEEYVNVDNRRERYSDDRYNSRQGYAGSNNYNAYDDFSNYRNDRMLRMSIGNRYRLSAFDDFFWNDGYSNFRFNNYAYSFNNPWNSYHYWNNFYNPYTRFNFNNPYYGNSGFGYMGPGNVVIVNPKTSTGPLGRPRVSNPGLYMNNYTNNNLYLDRNTATSRPSASGVNNRYNNSNSNSNTRRKIFSSSDNSYYNNGNNNEYRSNRSSSNNSSYTQPATRSTYEAPVRSYNPSSSSSSSSGSSSGSGGGGGGVSRPSRGN